VANWHIDKIEPSWDNDHQLLNYEAENFNNPDDIINWERKGYKQPFVGELCDMRKPQAWYTDEMVKYFKNKYSLENVGTSFYRMSTGIILPNHRDTYKKYRELFGVSVHQIQRIIVFLENWRSGHYFEIEGTPIVDWQAGDYVWWRGDAEHMAANLGTEYRYTLQITGHDGL
jgi:hypothetical protein